MGAGASPPSLPPQAASAAASSAVSAQGARREKENRKSENKQNFESFISISSSLGIKLDFSKSQPRRPIHANYFKVTTAPLNRNINRSHICLISLHMLTHQSPRHQIRNRVSIRRRSYSKFNRIFGLIRSAGAQRNSDASHISFPPQIKNDLTLMTMGVPEIGADEFRINHELRISFIRSACINRARIDFFRNSLIFRIYIKHFHNRSSMGIIITGMA